MAPDVFNEDQEWRMRDRQTGLVGFKLSHPIRRREMHYFIGIKKSPAGMPEAREEAASQEQKCPERLVFSEEVIQAREGPRPCAGWPTMDHLHVFLNSGHG